jgi:hypothetical protein
LAQSAAVIEVPKIVPRIGEEASAHPLINRIRATRDSQIAPAAYSKIGTPLMENIIHLYQSEGVGALVVPFEGVECVWEL